LLSESEIVAAAVVLTREVGLDNLSMRALARELDTAPMTIYNYVPSKDALQELVMNQILSEIRVPEHDEGTWEERLRQVLRDSRRAFADHPGISAKLASSGSAEATRLAEGFLSILRDGGFGPEAAVLSFVTFYTFMTGQIDLDAMAKAVVSRSPTATLEGVTDSTPFSRDDLFEFGFDVVVEGLKIKLSDQ